MTTPGHRPGAGRGAAARLRTGSLRRRVTVAGLLVIVAVILLLAVATDVAFAAQSRRDTEAALRQRGQVAEQLARQGTPSQELLRRVRSDGFSAQLTLPNGRTVGAVELPPGFTPRRGLQRAGQLTVLDRPLSDGSRLVLVADGTQTTTAQRRLRRLLVLVGLAALIVAVAALVLVVRVALAPLDALTGAAQSIARGERGRRLAPTRTDTELGRAAGAFDDMVDALEGAERAARTSEGRTRRFVADAAHELRTPLAGVQAAAEAVLQAGPVGSPEERERLHVLLVREARRAGRLVEDLLVLARIDAGLELHRSPVDLTALAHTEAERTRLLAPDLDVTVAVDGPAVAHADPERVAQVLTNLLDNARRYARRITVRTAARGAWVEVAVADDGPGVPPADRERVFDRLVRLDTARTAHSGGAGLGLAIARGIARAHGGELRCAEPHGPGALFVLTLPASPEAPTMPGA
ncbi:MAG TPA: HAMP domain-containing sensor histidine kinase [Pseudonocardiaceae bacterium]